MNTPGLCDYTSQMHIHKSAWLGLLLLFLLPACALADATNLFGENGGFERSAETVDNLWDGVDGDGHLAGFNASAPVVTESGAFGGLAMPPSVAFADLNGDGKPDLITADPTGYFRFYPNSGTAAAPKFTNAEIIPLYFPGVACPRFALADWRRTGLLDFLIGDYLGDILFVPNAGVRRHPSYFASGGGVDRARLQTDDHGRYWANLLSPVAYDWNGDGKMDLICGEGTYSANAIHLLENAGSGNPRFSSARHTVLAYGDGREQLMPAIADFNGDGFPDLAVADRTGQVSLYLSAGKPRLGVELTRTSAVSFGGAPGLPGLCGIFAADYNGDGLIDLIVGLPNGRVAVALNIGTKTQPAFGPIQEIRGVDRLVRNIRSPTGWTTDVSASAGNALGYFRVVNAQEDPASQPPEGANCLKAGYWPALGQTFPMPATGIPGAKRHFILSFDDIPVAANKSCHFSFQAKGSGMERAHWNFSAHAASNISFDGDFDVSNNWAATQADFTAHSNDPAFRGVRRMNLKLTVDFWAQNLSSVLYLDDFRLVQGD